MYKKELERKHREEQEATAHAFQEFIKTFQDVSGPPNKLFVRSGVLNARNAGKEEDACKGKIYNPSASAKPNPHTLKNAIECARLLKDHKPERSKACEKPKSNLELLKEELRIRHIERNEKQKADESAPSFAFFDSADQNTTNLFVANISPKMTEQDLIKIFGAYGPLASVKIMWPRNDDKGRTNCGFVAYMSRKDGERALQELKNREDMRIGWGKSVELPAHPIYIPQDLLKILLPPPYTGLPFNAQPLKQPFEYPESDEEMQQLLYNSVVKVTIPLDKKALMLIHRIIEFVVTEGPMFEAVIMNREINNPAFQFLFDNKCPSHVYYRWKLYSVLKGESVSSWSSDKFRMFEGGSVWVPPVLPDYSQGMPENLVKIQEKSSNLLSDAQKSRLIQYIQNLSLSRAKIGEAMVFCLNHSDASREVAEIVSDAALNVSTKPIKRIARLYLISDILRNSALKKNDAFRRHFMRYIGAIFEQLKTCGDSMKLVTDRDMFKSRVSKVLRAWDLWKIFPLEYLTKLEAAHSAETEGPGEDSGTDEPLDGKNLIKRIKNERLTDAKKSSAEAVILSSDKSKTNINNNPPPGFIPSKWETVDPEQVEAQAMSTKKFHDFEMENLLKNAKPKVADRETLRQVEVSVMKYQDELESGKRKLRKGVSLEEQLDDFRQHLLAKIKKESECRQTSPISSDSFSSDDGQVEKKTKKYSRKRNARAYKDKEKSRKYSRK